MKKHVVLLSGILQFIAVVMFFGTIRAGVYWSSGRMTGLSFLIALAITVFAQIASSKLKEKYPDEVSKATDIVLTPKNSYGLIALTVLALGAVFSIVYGYYLMK